MAGKERDAPDRAPVLTRDGRIALEERVRRLQDEVIPALARRAREGGSELQVAEDHERALFELSEISALLRHGVDAEDLPADPNVVELGDTVTLEMPDGTIERFVIVHPTEAPVDRMRISSESPMSRAVLGCRVGEKVEVSAPAGRYEVEVLGVER